MRWVTITSYVFNQQGRVYFLLLLRSVMSFFFFFQAEDGIRDVAVTGVQTCALPIFEGVEREGAGEDAFFLRGLVGALGLVLGRHLLDEGLDRRSLLGRGDRAEDRKSVV